MRLTHHGPRKVFSLDFHFLLQKIHKDGAFDVVDAENAVFGKLELENIDLLLGVDALSSHRKELVDAHSKIRQQMRVLAGSVFISEFELMLISFLMAFFLSSPRMKLF